jgi:hypothetical protein
MTCSRPLAARDGQPDASPICADRRRVPRWGPGARDSGLPGSLATCTSGRGGCRPECLDRVEALADKHGIDRDFARRLGAELHRY